MEIRTQYCINFFKQVQHLPGDVIEMGVSAGATTFPLAEVANQKKVYACDTFEGLPYDDIYDFPQVCKKGELNGGIAFFEQYHKITDSNIIPVRGLIEESLNDLTNATFCFAWLDLDLYKPTSFAYKFLEDRMVRGGIIGFHDYQFIRCPGIQIVVDNEVDYTKYKVIFNNAPEGLFIQKLSKVLHL